MAKRNQAGARAVSSALKHIERHLSAAAREARSVARRAKLSWPILVIDGCSLQDRDGMSLRRLLAETPISHLVLRDNPLTHVGLDHLIDSRPSAIVQLKHLEYLKATPLNMSTTRAMMLLVEKFSTLHHLT